MTPKVLLWYDVEDYITEESDDALLALLEMMEARGIRGAFKLVGEKIRVMESRGRGDILAKLAGQDIGYHTDMHSVHPTVSEYCEPLGFAAGAAEFEKREAGGIADVRRILGKPVATYGQPGSSWAPQAFPVLRKWGIPTYIDSCDVIDMNGGPFWFCGILTLTHLRGIMRMELTENGLDNAKRRFDELAGEGEQWISIYYHPCEFATTEFWDGVNFARGANPSREHWKKPRLREAGQMRHYVDMLGKFLDYLLSRGCEFITASQLTEDRFFAHPDLQPELRGQDVLRIAEGWDKSIDSIVYRGHAMSASEVFSLLRSRLLGEKLAPVLLYGPENDIVSDPDAAGSLEDYRKALRAQYPEVMGYPQLPDCFYLGGRRVSPADMARTLAFILKNNISEQETVPVLGGSLAAQRHVNTDVNWDKKWPIFPDNFKACNLVKIAMRQAWTLKPAASANAGKSGCKSSFNT